MSCSRLDVVYGACYSIDSARKTSQGMKYFFSLATRGSMLCLPLYVWIIMFTTGLSGAADLFIWVPSYTFSWCACCTGAGACLCAAGRDDMWIAAAEKAPLKWRQWGESGREPGGKQTNRWTGWCQAGSGANRLCRMVNGLSLPKNNRETRGRGNAVSCCNSYR